MKLKVGDKVKFLNQTGGGVVSKVLNSTMVNVAIEDGFEIPTRISELIRIDDITGPGGFFTESYTIEIPEPGNDRNLAETDDRVNPLVKFSSKNNLATGIYLAFVPHDQKWLMTGPVEILLINNTSYDVLVNFYLKDPSGEFTGIDYDVVPADSKLLIETIHREDIEKWCQGVIQLLFHKDRDPFVRVPVHVPYRIEPVRFYKDVNFRESNLLQERALLHTVHELAVQPETIPVEPTGKTEQPVASRPESTRKVSTILIDQHRIEPRTAEVDLHISALLDDYSSMKKHEIMAYQTEYFRKCLESALEYHYHTVYFIHGVGNGTLRNAILEILHAYGDLEVRDAPYDLYGTGGLQVFIRENL
jgi:hypothetical protein